MSEVQLPTWARPAPLVRRWVDRARGTESDDLLSLRPGRSLDPVGVADLVAWGGLVGTRSLLVGVERLRLSWSLPRPRLAASRSARVDQFWDLLRAAVVEAGPGRLALSGGLDSRALAAAAAQEGVAVDVGTFGDADCIDLPVAAEVARRLGLPQVVSLLEPEGALACEERVWNATDGTGGPASAPGSPTDAAWAGCTRLLSGTSGDVIWGDTPLPGPSPPARLKRLGLAAPPGLSAPPAPSWVRAPEAWTNLWTRQSAVTWNGVLPRLAFTPVVPVAWQPDLLAFCLALPPEDRAGRSLLREVLERHAPEVGATALPPVHGAVHDLDRAFRAEPWRAELQRWSADVEGLRRVGLEPAAVARMVRQTLRGARDRAGFLSRLRAVWRWGL